MEVEKLRKTREDRLHEIQENAKNLFLEKGFKSTTMEDIVAATGLSKGGLYHYYSSTKAILIDLIDRWNILYIEDNPALEAFKLTEEPSQDLIVDLIMKAIIDKVTVQTPERKIYLMFAYEMMYDNEIREIYLSHEKVFIENVLERLGIKGDSVQKQMYLISYLVNALTFSQNLLPNGEILLENRTILEDIFRPQLMRLIGGE